MTTRLSVVMLGASGAVGSHVVGTLLAMPQLAGLSLLNRRRLDLPSDARLRQHVVDVLAPPSYRHLLAGHRAAVCTLGVGEPSKIGKAEFVRIDKDAVLDFARACKEAGIEHFELLGSVGADPGSASFYLRTKGELERDLEALGFARLSLFRPSMILTPTNRYGFTQAMTLAVWPRLNPLLQGSWRRYRGIPVASLGAAMARNLAVPGAGVEVLQWDDFMKLTT
ncbi:MAG TPA: NAD(P)H-binding protein [Paucimonas sp.]|nr:NAD(P)H-binding protein [Paucimonas sp.]